MQVCRTCQNRKPEEAFSLRSDTGRRRTDCAACIKSRRQKYWGKNKAAFNLKQQARYQKNRDVLLEKQNAYSAQNREREAARSRQWRKANPDRVRELNQKSYWENPQKMRDAAKRYAKENPDVIKHNARLRKARVRGAAIRDLTRKQWAEILKINESRCIYCGVSGEMTQDHDIPISRGGAHSATNVVPACLPCNMRKHDKTGEEFRALLKKEKAAR